MPLVFRAMKADNDGRPLLGQSATCLGVRPTKDIDLDDNQQVLANGRGMSVAPSWRQLPVWRIPKRLRDLQEGARGSNETACFRFGSGPFATGPFAPGLRLVQDSERHACVAPVAVVPLSDYEASLAATRLDWIVDEG